MDFRLHAVSADKKARYPILMLTTRDATNGIVLGLAVGADDYLTKRFSLDVLLGRLRSLERRGIALLQFESVI